ncbi:MAG: enoyl-CoA hydratase/isomerase family protein [Chloroflexi bacterium]|nr:enoyl-CoA hydratase/isomerase family protein [Chloroflexota bacterium]
MAYTSIHLERDGPMAVLTLNRPQALNALNSALRQEMEEALTLLEIDDDVRVVIITGAGRDFSAGGDIKEQVANADLTPQERARRQSAGAPWTWHVANYRKPTIGAINGIAYGGAALLSSCLDIRIGCEKTSFRFLAASYGQVNSTWSLPLIVGLPKAKELMFTGREVFAEEALQIGLLNKLVASERLMEEAKAMAGMIADSHPVMVQGIKRLLHQGIGAGFPDRYQMERDATTTWMRPVNPREGFKDFLARKGE